MGAKTVRIDELLVQRGLFDSLDQASRAVFAGEVISNDVHVQAPSQKVNPGIDLTVRGRSRFVSRGGYKLQGALDELGVNPAGLNCIDVGASSGGFTDCLLQNGAARVAAVDVGYAEFAWSLRNDPRVALYERTNIKSVTPDDVGGPFDLLVADVSFISLTSLLPVFRQLVGDAGSVLIMVKPQFEAQRDQVADGGVVRSAQQHVQVLEHVVEQMRSQGFCVQGLAASPVPGKKKGNLEFFVLACSQTADTENASLAQRADASIDIEGTVARAHQRLGE